MPDSQLPRYMTTGKLKPRLWEMGSIPGLLTTQACPWTVDLHVPGTRKAHWFRDGVAAQMSEQPSCGLTAYGAQPTSTGMAHPGLQQPR